MEDGGGDETLDSGFCRALEGFDSWSGITSPENYFKDTNLPQAIVLIRLRLDNTYCRRSRVVRWLLDSRYFRGVVHRKSYCIMAASFGVLYNGNLK